MKTEVLAMLFTALTMIILIVLAVVLIVMTIQGGLSIVVPLM